jgi:hypothetical protein
MPDKIRIDLEHVATKTCNSAVAVRSACLDQVAFHKFDRGHSGKTSSYNLRPLLWEAGGTASNKVLECLVLRFAKNRVLTSECFVMAMVRLHLAHGEFPTPYSGTCLALGGIC